MKQNFIKLVTAVTLTTLGFACSLTQKKSSEVPDRREFPLSQTTDACEDFFEYACGPAIERFELRPDRSRHIFSFNDSADRILETKKAFLAGLSSLNADLNAKSIQLRDYYLSCMNTNARANEEREALVALKKELANIKSKKQWGQWLTAQALKGKPSHLTFMNVNNLDDNSVHDLLVIPTLMTSMPDRSYYENQELMQDFEQLIEAFFEVSGVENPSKHAKTTAALEAHYILNYPTPAERRPLWSKKAYVNKNQFRRYPQLQLNEFFKVIPASVKIRHPMDEPFAKLNAAFNQFPLEQLKMHYLFWAGSGLIDESHPQYFNKAFAFRFKHLGGPPERSVLNERCTEDVMSRFLKELDHEVYPLIFSDFSEEKFVALLEKVRSSIIEGLNQNTWLSAKSKAGALDKIKKARFQVVKPTRDEDWDFNPIIQYQPDRYIENQEKLRRALTERSLARLTEKVNPNKWWMGPLTVNAYYSPSENKFVMPAGILQYPFYDPNLPDWVNLGAVGMVVGHELGHGIDDQGAKYDAYGRVRQWMSDKDVNAFKQRGQRLIAQFNEAGHNGELTLGENIGDLVGLTFALNAAQKTMPTDEAARDQATKDFFIQYARGWCGVMRPKEIEKRLKTDPHALVWARVNEQVKHQSEFARVFACRPGQALYLNEADRIAIW